MKKAELNRKEGAPVLETPQEIPRGEWLRRLDLFSAHHHGWSGKLELTQPGGTSRVEAQDLPFEGINLDSEGSDKVEITLEKDRANRIMHTVPGTRKIILKSPDAIEIESADGTRTVLSCRPLRNDQ